MLLHIYYDHKYEELGRGKQAHYVWNEMIQIMIPCCEDPINVSSAQGYFPNTILHHPLKNANCKPGVVCSNNEKCGEEKHFYFVLNENEWKEKVYNSQQRIFIIRVKFSHSVLVLCHMAHCCTYVYNYNGISLQCDSLV